MEIFFYQNYDRMQETFGRIMFDLRSFQYSLIQCFKWENWEKVRIYAVFTIFPSGNIGENRGKLKMEKYLKATTSLITLTARSRFSVLLCITV